MRRMLSLEPSGRGFLQELSDKTENSIETGHFFESLKSCRRLRLCTEFNKHLITAVDDKFKKADPYAEVKELQEFDIYSGDGHYHKAACFDKRKGSKQKKYAVQHFYSLNMRTHSMQHITLAETTGEKKKEHDMHAIKRIGPQQMRLQARTGRKVLWVWDRAAINGLLWQKWKSQHGIYFISRTKEGMTLEKSGDLPFDNQDPMNAGVIRFELVSCGNAALRCVTYRCPDTQEEFSFLSSLTTCRPGVIVALYKERWDIEKVYDEVKNKFSEKKSWATTKTAKCMQAEFICIHHNQMLLLERQLEDEHDVKNTKEEARREKRLRTQKKVCQALGEHSIMPTLMATARKISQRTLPFMRWLRNNFDTQSPWETRLNRLQRAYRV